MPKPAKPNKAPEAPQVAPQAELKTTAGLAVAGNLVACVLVGMLLGWGGDWFFSTQPWGLLIGLVLGFLAWLKELWGLLQT